MNGTRTRTLLTLPLVLLGAAACGPADDTSGDAAGDSAALTTSDAGNDMIELLASGEAVFGIFSGEHTPEAGRLMGASHETDFVFYSLESGPFDIPALEAYMTAMAEAAGGDPPPVALRIPPIRDDRETAAHHIRQGLEAGASALVYPHVESVQDVALATSTVGDRLWPTNPEGDVLNVLLIEDQEGIARARDIVSAPGAGVVVPGPGDLRRAYEGDMEAVEGAIQTVLEACKEFEVACGITAGVDDIGMRLEQGFRFIIVTEPEAIAVGKAAAGRAG